MHDLVTWHGINYTGMQITQWDFQNKGKLGWTGASSFVLEVPLCNLHPSVIYSVPCDRIVPRAYLPQFERTDAEKVFPVCSSTYAGSNPEKLKVMWHSETPPSSHPIIKVTMLIWPLYSGRNKAQSFSHGHPINKAIVAHWWLD